MIYTKRKIAYLTIDDSPTEDMKEKADYLLEKRIPAIWFCVGGSLEKYIENALHAIGLGFVIGNHSYSHKRFSSLSLEEAFGEIKKTDEIIDYIYGRAGVKRPAKLFRFPYGNKGVLADDDPTVIFTEQDKNRKNAIQGFLKELGYVQGKFPGVTYEYMQEMFEDIDWYWTFDTMDWALNRPDKPCGIDSLEKIFAKIDRDRPEDFEGLNSGVSDEIILIHDQPGTKQVFKAIIEKLLYKELDFRIPDFPE